MALSSGMRLGPYDILSPLGSGGMGEIYKARDTRLDRTVALKILSSTLAADPVFRERFSREARLISQLDHPHICALYDVGQENGTSFLVMPYLEGQTLAVRLQRGALQLPEALTLAIQIASALDAAHRAGIVHRDLKPANIMLTARGVKLLDFGLAKAATAAVVGPGLSMLPTTPANLTGQGAILGTFQYMAPEQLEGKEADSRSDIFAFGLVLYEMLTGKKAFEAKSHAGLIAAILDQQPPAPSTLRPLTPPSVDHIVATCLAKDPDQRWQSTADLVRELRWIEEGLGKTVAAASAGPSSNRARWLWATAVLIAGITIGVAVSRILREPRTERRAEVIRTLVDVTPAEQLQASPGDLLFGRGRPNRTAMTFSPDGRFLVFSAVRDGRQQLYKRSLGDFEATPIVGTENGASPFFSPDGQFLGFLAIRPPGIPNELMKVSFPQGGAAIKLCDAPVFRGATWGSDDTIVFGARDGRLWRVSAAGGNTEPLTVLDDTKREFSHRLPSMLPGKNAVLFTVTHDQYPRWDATEIAVHSLGTGERKMLIQGGADARYLSSGHLAYMRRGVLMAAPFSLERLEVTGPAVALLPDVMQATHIRNDGLDQGAGQFSVSASGTLAYLPGGVPPDFERSFLWVSRTGIERPVTGPTGPYAAPRLSPDGKRIAFSTLVPGNRNIWLLDLVRGGTVTPVTDDGVSEGPVWADEGKRLAFISAAGRVRRLLWKRVDVNEAPEVLTTRDNLGWVHTWTSKGSTLAFVDLDATTQADVWQLSVAGDRQPRPILNSRHQEAQPDFSPDGNWLAYSSSLSGRLEVYVQEYPRAVVAKPVSTGGGQAPHWSNDGRELFYMVPTAPGSDVVKMMAVPVTTRPTFTAGTPRLLFEGKYQFGGPVRVYDVSPDGQQFLLMRELERPAVKPTHMTVVQNWFDELKARVPVP